MDSIDNQLQEQLHPQRITGASDQMYFIISTILGAGWVTSDRAYGGFSITSDGFVTSGGLFLGSAADFEKNVRGYVAAADLPVHLANRFWDRYACLVSDWRPGGNAEMFTADLIRLLDNVKKTHGPNAEVSIRVDDYGVTVTDAPGRVVYDADTLIEFTIGFM